MKRSGNIWDLHPLVHPLPVRYQSATSPLPPKGENVPRRKRGQVWSTGYPFAVLCLVRSSQPNYGSEIHKAAICHQRGGLVAGDRKVLLVLVMPFCSALSIFTMRRHISADIKRLVLRPAVVSGYKYKKIQKNTGELQNASMLFIDAQETSYRSEQLMAVHVSSMVRHQYVCHLVTSLRLTTGRNS